MRKSVSIDWTLRESARKNSRDGASHPQHVRRPAGFAGRGGKQGEERGLAMEGYLKEPRHIGGVRGQLSKHQVVASSVLFQRRDYRMTAVVFPAIRRWPNEGVEKPLKQP